MIEALDKIGPVVCRYIMAAWLGWAVLDEIIHHGEPKSGTRDGFSAFFGCIVMVMLLAGGGLWG